MKSVTLRTKIITGIITGGMLLSSVSLAFATGTKSTKSDAKAPSKTEFRQPKAELESTLKLGVSTGIITQIESDKILAYQNSKTKDKTVRIDIYKDLVDNNILPQAKADALKASEQVQRDAERQKNLNTKLAKLVTDKTITQDQSDKIKAAIASEEVTNKAEREKTKTMTEAERKTYMESNKATHVNALKALVDAGTITQAQADKVGPGALGGRGERGRDMKHSATIDPTVKLAKLVTDKTITQNQADKIKAAIVKEEAARKVEMEKTKTMTAAERTAYMESNKTNHVSPLKALVDAGTITQAQADKVGPGANNHMLGIKIK